MALIFVNRFFHPDRSATGQMLSDLAVGLAQSRQDVRVITGRRRYDEPGATLPPRENIEGVDVNRVWTTGFGRGVMVGRAIDYISFFLAACLAVFTGARRGDIVIAMTDPPLLGVPLSWIARWRGVHLVNWLQDLLPEVGQALATPGLNTPLGALLCRVRNASLRTAACNVVLGELMATRVRSAAGKAAKISVIPNWADDAAVGPIAPEDNPLRTFWGLADKFVVGYSGNLGRAHDVETLLDAARRLTHRNDVAFLFVGGGFHLDAIKARITQAGDDRFVFKPYQERADLGQSLCVADVHWTSLKPALEGLIVPSKVYGIAAAGRPILHVGSGDGEIANMVARFGGGLVIAEGDGVGLARAIENLCDDAFLRDELGVQARQMIEDHFSRAAGLARWSELLRSLETQADA